MMLRRAEFWGGLFWLGVGAFIITLVADWFSLQGIANVWKSA